MCAGFKGPCTSFKTFTEIISLRLCTYCKKFFYSTISCLKQPSLTKNVRTTNKSDLMINFLGTLSEPQSATLERHFTSYAAILLQRPGWLGLGPLLTDKIDVIYLNITHNLQITNCDQEYFMFALGENLIKNPYARHTSL